MGFIERGIAVMRLTRVLALLLELLVTGLLTAGLSGPAAAAGAADALGRFAVEHFIVTGDNPLSQADTAAVLAPHLGPQVGLNDLTATVHALEDALRNHGYLFHRVLLPPQTIEHATVTLRVEPFKIGAVTVTGNTHFSVENVRRAVPQIRTGPPPEVQPLTRSLLLANDNPARHISLNLKESAAADAVDAELVVKDRKPWTVFANGSNVGTADAGRTRLAVGVQDANLFGYDDALALSYTTSPESWSAVKQWGANYKVPLYGSGGVTALYYAHSDVDSGRIQNVFDVSGAGDFFGLSYTQYLWDIGALRQQVSLGVDDRDFQNNVSFLGTPIGSDVHSRPATLRYQANYRGPGLSGGVTLGYSRNLRGGSHNDTGSYRRVRTGAQQDWDAWHYSGNLTLALPWAMQLRLAVEGQYAGEALIPGEQFGIGGATSVRAFEERSITGDDGTFGNVELYAPPLGYGVQVLGFVDAGQVHRHRAQAGELRNDTVVSAGAGARWQWQDNLALSLDVAHEITAASTTGAGRAKVHFNLFVRY